MKYLSSHKGFTMIELLCVIAIIGLLSTVLFASLRNARGRSRDASAKTSMASMKNATLLVIAQNGQYPATLCSSTLLSLLNAVDAQIPGSPTCNQSADRLRWAVSATMNNNSVYCVDSTGYVGASTAVLGSCSGVGGGGS